MKDGMKKNAVARAQSAGGWKYILAQIKTVVETGKMLNTMPDTPAETSTATAADVQSPTKNTGGDVQSPKKKRSSGGTPTGTSSSGNDRPKRGKKE